MIYSIRISINRINYVYLLYIKLNKITICKHAYGNMGHFYNRFNVGLGHTELYIKGHVNRKVGFPKGPHN